MNRGPILGQVRLVLPRAPRLLLSGGGYRLGIQALTDDTFGQALSAPRAIIMFGGPGCVYCEAYKPVFEAAADRYSNDLLMATADITDAPQAVSRYGIRGIPVTVFLSNGKEIHRVAGALEEGDLKAEITRLYGPMSADVPPPQPAAPLLEPEPEPEPEPTPAPWRPGTQAAPMPGMPETATKTASKIPILPIAGGVALVGLAILLLS